jgi:hypothetical protein
LAIERLEAREVPSAVSWTGAGDGTSWNDLHNWSSLRVPGSGDDVTITATSAKIGISTAVTVNSLNLNNSGQYAWLSLPSDGHTDLTITGLFTWTDGELLSSGNPGHVRANGGVAMSGGITFGALPLECILDNAATATVNGVELGAGAGVWNNLAGSELDLVNNGSFVGNLNNDGIIVSKSITSILSGGSSTGITNQGAIEVQTGTLSLGGQVASTGPITVAAGATLNFGEPASYNVAATLGIGATVTGAGNVGFISDSTVTLADTYNVTGLTQIGEESGNGTSVTFNGSTTMGALNLLVSGTLSGSANVTVSGALDWEGTMTGGGSTVANGNTTLTNPATSTGPLWPILWSRTFDNYGTCTSMLPYGPLAMVYGATWNNQAGSVMDFQDNSGVQWGNTGAMPTFNNAGTLEWTSGTSGQPGFDFPITNTGTLWLQGANHQVSLTQNFVNAGTVSVDSGSSLAISGNYQQTSAGVLDLGIGGPVGANSGYLTIGGVATLNGTFNVSVQNGYTPKLNDYFYMMGFSSESGTFATVNGLALGNNLNLSLGYSATSLGLQVTQANAGAATHVSVSAPASAIAGNSFTITITALDANNNVATGYTGTVHFTSTDPHAVLPADYTFTAADAGMHTFSATLKTAGSQSITATDIQTSSITGAGTLAVSPAAAASFLVAGLPGSTTAGVAQNFTVTAQDAYGNTATSYTGTVHFSSSDTQAGLPANYTFVAGDNGTHAFSATFKTAGTQSVTATDTQASSVTGSQSLAVSPAAAKILVVTGFPSSATAGVAQNFTITAKDAYGNIATGYTGTVHFTSSDTKAVLPANYTFTAADAGIHAFSATLKTAGSKTVTATDTVTATLTAKATVTVVAAAATHFKVTGSATATAGKAFSLTVTALDAYGNTATGYLGTVHFTTSDVQGVVPPNYTFVAGDKGKHTFTNGVVLKTAGKETVTATDTVTGSITGAASSTVNPAAASKFVVSGFPTSAIHGVAYTFTVTALDAYGNVATGYRGTVHFSSSDGSALLPANYTFTAADKGKHTFSATLNTLGIQSLTATDTVTATITGTEGGITVS